MVRRDANSSVDQDSGDDSSTPETPALKRRRVSIESSQAETADEVANNGIIKSIELVNFMCHKYLKIDFGPQINFVIGHNGSGKSAILTAIVVCLGAKAAVTQRASSLKSLIKEGCNSASITVTIKNEGDDAFKPEKYGNEIHVERILQQSGSAMYKIKSSKNVMVSKDKEELTNMMDHFGLMVDNPMTILSQDTARSFLSSSTPEEKYALFMKGIRVDSLKQDYDMFRICLEKTHGTLLNRQKAFAELKARRDEAKKLYDQTRNHRHVKEHLTMLQAQLVWATYADKEAEIEKCELEVHRKQKESILAAQAIEELGAQYEAMKLRLAQATEELDGARLQTEPNRQEIARLRGEQSRVKEAMREVQADERDTVQTIKMLEEKIRATERSIDIERTRLAEMDGGKLGQIRSDLSAAADRRQQQKSDLQAAESEYSLVKADEQAHLELEEATKKALQRKREDLRAVERRIREQQSYQNQYMSVYGPKIDQILHAIEAENRFHAKPLGPVGRYIHVKRPEWVNLLEGSLSSSLDAFVVTSQHDRELLNEILTKYQSRGNIIVRKNESFNFSGNRPSDQFTSVLDILEFENDAIKYMLIDVHSIERTILIADRREADEVMYRNPRNVKMCLAQKRGDKYDGFRIIQKKGASVSQPQRGRRQAPRMRVNNELRLDELKHEYKDIEAEIEEINAKVHTLSLKTNDFRRRGQALNSKIYNLRADIEKTASLIEDLNMQLVSADDSSKLPVLEEAKERQQEDLRRQQESRYAAIVDQKDRLKQELLQISEAIEAKKSELEEHEVMASRYEVERDGISGEVIKLNSDMEYRRKQLDKRQQDMASHESRLAEMREQAQKILELCEAVSRRRPDLEGKTYAMLNEEILVMQRQYEKDMEQLPLPLDQIAQNFNDLSAECNSINNELRELRSLVDTLHATYRMREKRFFLFRNKICTNAKNVFQLTLDERGFQGRMYINHHYQTLHIEVKPADGNGENGGKRNVTTLSGGEKSYTQICLLMSLWDAMNTPLRGLDEFDVFMDAVNRRISLGMMIDRARQNAATQTIFITPQDMGNVKLGSEVKITRMADPERAQIA